MSYYKFPSGFNVNGLHFNKHDWHYLNDDMVAMTKVDATEGKILLPKSALKRDDDGTPMIRTDASAPPQTVAEALHQHKTPPVGDPERKQSEREAAELAERLTKKPQRAVKAPEASADEKSTGPVRRAR